MVTEGTQRQGVLWVWRAQDSQECAGGKEGRAQGGMLSCLPVQSLGGPSSPSGLDPIYLCDPG